jgi:hypothetical protein
LPPVLVGVNELVREVLLGSVLPHLDSCSTNYSRVAGARLRLHPEELPEQDPVGLDPQKRLTEVDEDSDMENTVGVEVEVLNVVVPQEAFEEIACRQCESALREAREHWDLIFALLHGVRVPGGGPPTVHLLLTDESTVEEGQQIFGLRLRLFPLAARIWPGGDIGGAAPAAATAASSQPLFFPAVFTVLDRDGLILQVHDPV